jgi:monothiol glutaredoxin
MKTAMSEASVQDWIKEQVTANNVVLFMKGTKDFPQCGFSSRVVQILDHIGVDFKDINVLADNDIREGVKIYAKWPTFPQLYIKGEFVGGCDIVSEMFQANELQRELKEKGVPFAKSDAVV